MNELDLPASWTRLIMVWSGMNELTSVEHKTTNVKSTRTNSIVNTNVMDKLNPYLEVLFLDYYSPLYGLCSSASMKCQTKYHLPFRADILTPPGRVILV